jgi:hypothetical protein
LQIVFIKIEKALLFYKTIEKKNTIIEKGKKERQHWVEIGKWEIKNR